MNELDINLNEIIQIIETRRNNALKKVNEELILLYWDFGKYISEKINSEKWGNKTVDNLVNFIKINYPNLKGFNRPGIYRMKQFYETYKNYPEIISTLLRQLSWSNHIKILSSTETIEEKEFYMKLAIHEKYSTRELARQIDSSYYQRYLLSKEKFKNIHLPVLNENNLSNTKFLDTYVLEFLNLPTEFSEKDLQTAIIKNLKSFILEIGKDFSFVGEEYRIQVGNRDYFIDLLFYNRELACLVAFELKIGEFKPEYISKMNFYLEALDKLEKKIGENPSVGIILCSNKDEDIVEFTMNRNMSPTLIAEYKLKLIDKQLLANKLKEFSNMLK